MKRMVMIFAFLAMCSFVKAQYWGSCNNYLYEMNRLNQQLMQQAAQSFYYQQQQWSQQYQEAQQRYQRQQEIQQQQIQYQNTYQNNSVEYQNNNNSNNSKSRGNRTCGQCNGTGKVIANTASYGLEKWCSECNRKVSAGHYHATCPGCKGRGSW